MRDLPLGPILSDGKGAAGKVLFQALAGIKEKGGEEIVACIGEGKTGHVTPALLPDVTVWRSTDWSCPTTHGMSLATWAISAICRYQCSSANTLADGTLFLGVYVFSS